MAKFKCSICGWECSDNKKFQESVESHLLEMHHMSFIDYYEMKLMSPQDKATCWKCGKPRCHMTTWCDKYPLPCWDCVNTTIKTEAQDATKVILGYYKDIQSRISKNKFLQYYLGLEDSDWNRFLTHSYKNTEELLFSIVKRDKIKLTKESFFKIEANPWSLKEYSERNKDNLHCILNPDSFPKRTELREKKKEWNLKLSIGEVTVCAPFECEYDIRHHSRYSILNLGAKRQTRKLRMGDSPPWTRCIKFYNTEFQGAKSIVGVFLKDDKKRDKVIPVRSLSPEDRFKLKQFVFKCKEIWKGITEIFNELLKYVKNVDDSVFAYNHVFVGPYQNDIDLNFKWYFTEPIVPGRINLSIL